jgi:Zn-dependent protease
MTISNGSLRLFKLFGITVFVHWSWLIVAAIAIRFRTDIYSTPLWNASEYLALFAIVLMHEFGHALACRSVGGKAETIMLWPLGGIAFVSPPMRPGALLWSIFAGPLVNIILLPITMYVSYRMDMVQPDTNAAYFAYMIANINLVLLLFNMVPVYPLDGGQILHALLWFALGYAKSLRVVSIIGLIGAAGLAVVFYKLHFGAMSFVILAFIAMEAWKGFKLAQYLSKNPAVAAHIERSRNGSERVLLEEDPRQRENNEGKIQPPL